MPQRQLTLIFLSSNNIKASSCYQRRGGGGERDGGRCTYLPLPATHYDLQLPQGNSLPHTHRPLHLAYSCAHGLCVRKIKIRWAGACGGSVDHPCPFPLFPLPCTTQWWGSAFLQLYSLKLPVLLWKQLDQKGVRQFEVGNLLAEDGSLQDTNAKLS